MNDHHDANLGDYEPNDDDAEDPNNADHDAVAFQYQAENEEPDPEIPPLMPNIDIPLMPDIDEILAEPPLDVDDDIDANPNEDARIDNQIEDDEDFERREDLQQRLREEMDRKYGERSGRYDLRARRPRDYGHMNTTLSSTIFTQYSMKKGLEKFKEAGVKAVKSELKQLHDRDVLLPRSSRDLSKRQRVAALAYLMFLKKKEW